MKIHIYLCKKCKLKKISKTLGYRFTETSKTMTIVSAIACVRRLRKTDGF